MLQYGVEEVQSFKQEVFNLWDVLYLSSMGFGSQNTTQVTLFDTASDTSWVTTVDCWDCEYYGEFFDPYSDEETVVSYEQDVIFYGSGYVVGNVGTTSVTS